MTASSGSSCRSRGAPCSCWRRSSARFRGNFLALSPRVSYNERMASPKVVVVSGNPTTRRQVQRALGSGALRAQFPTGTAETLGLLAESSLLIIDAENHD